MRLTRSQRIRKGADFALIRALSSGGICAAFRIRYLVTDKGVRRLAVIASKRVGDAVRRNRAKRLLREAFRNAQDILPPSCDVLLIASKGICPMSGAEVVSHFRDQALRCVRRAGKGT